MRTILEQWENYLKEVIPEGAGESQKFETRLAFYAGAKVMMSALLEVGADSISDEAAAQLIDGYAQEMEAFISEITNPSN